MQSNSTCAFCFIEGCDFKKCGKCHKRHYCTKNCQTLDWKSGHNKWCGKAGEINYDFEIKPTKTNFFMCAGFKICLLQRY